jgi:hypothetical protein
MSNRIANHDRTIWNMLLICKTGTMKAEKNNEIVPVYACTIHGQIIVYVILYNERSRARIFATDMILDLIQHYFTAYNSHMSISL